jgi:HAD superfamily phosphatase (TIGR01681 family)
MVLLAGSYARQEIQVAASPNVQLPFISVSVFLDGASPSDTSRLIARPLENRLQTITGVKNISSSSSLSYTRVFLEFEVGYDMDRALVDIKQGVEETKYELPSEAEDPQISEYSEASFPVMNISIVGSSSVRQKVFYAKELKDRGITLAVCSKNDFENATEGFNHPESILKFDDFTSFKANWSPKHQNILDIAKEINIGIDSLVFIDDNPVERDIVLSQIPSISVPDVGSDVVEFARHIDRNGYFEPVSLSDDDINRSQYYKDNKKRINKQAMFKSYDEFLVSLDMTAEIKSFSSIYLGRITQLINKTNQFNLTTKRYTAGEIENISTSDEHIKIAHALGWLVGVGGWALRLFKP